MKQMYNGVRTEQEAQADKGLRQDKGLNKERLCT